MKVLFLDVDGVLNCEEAFRNEKYREISPYIIEAEKVAMVQRIVSETGCSIVLSSTWRNHEEGKKNVRDRGIDFIDCTPNTSFMRGVEIKLWLDHHPEVTKHAILDDDSDMLPDQKLFQTSWKTGLTDKITQQVIEYLL
jgi:hypothetical protein